MSGTAESRACVHGCWGASYSAFPPTLKLSARVGRRPEDIRPKCIAMYGKVARSGRWRRTSGRGAGPAVSGSGNRRSGRWPWTPVGAPGAPSQDPVTGRRRGNPAPLRRQPHSHAVVSGFLKSFGGNGSHRLVHMSSVVYRNYSSSIGECAPPGPKCDNLTASKLEPRSCFEATRHCA
jgi:hypothetical protein